MVVENKDGDYIVTGNSCAKGEEYAIQELTNPMRTLTTTVRTDSKKMPRIPVKSDNPIPKAILFDIMKEIDKITLKNIVRSGDIIIENILGTGSNIIATSDLYF